MTNAEARFNKIHIRKVYACLAVTCHLHFWQNNRDFLRATEVTRGWNGYRNKSQHRKSTLEKKILPPFQQGFEPATFQSRVRCSNHWAIPTPHMRIVGLAYLILCYLAGRTGLPHIMLPCWEDRLTSYYATLLGGQAYLILCYLAGRTGLPHITLPCWEDRLTSNTTLLRGSK